MGKSNRIRSIRETERSRVLGERNKKKGMPSWALTLITVVVAASILLTSTGVLLSSTGVIGRVVTVAKTDNYRVTANMLAYFYGAEYSDFYSTYGSYLSMFSLDTSLPHGEQPFAPEGSYDAMFLGTAEEGEEAPKTWRDYFMGLAVKRAETVLVYCEEAKARGLTLSQEDKDSIDAAIKQFADQATASGGYTLSDILALSFGQGVSEYDVRKGMEYEILASKASGEISTLLEEAIDKDPQSVENRYNEKKNQFDRVDMFYYTFDVKYDESAIAEKLGITDEQLKQPTNEIKEKLRAEYANQIEEARKSAKDLAAITDLDEFKQAIYKIVAEKTYDEKLKSAALTAEEKKLTVEESTGPAPAPAAEGDETNTETPTTPSVTDEDLAEIKKEIIALVLEEIKAGKDTTTHKVDLTATENKDKTNFTYFGIDGVSKKFVEKLNKVQTDVFAAVDTATETYNIEKSVYSEGDLVRKWAFDEQTKAGDTNIYHQYDGAKTGDEAHLGDDGMISADKIQIGESKKASVSVYKMIKTRYKDTEKSQNISYLVFTEKPSDEIMNSLKALTTKEAFEAKADELIAAKDTTKASFKNSIDNYEKGGLGSDELDEWLWNAETGDNKVMDSYVKITKSSTDYYVVTFRVNAGDELWFIEAKADLFNTEFEKKDTEIRTKYAPKLPEEFMLKDGFFKIVKVMGDK